MTDYGLDIVYSNKDFRGEANPYYDGMCRWLAPECMDHFSLAKKVIRWLLPKAVTLPPTESKTTDVFAFGMVAVEVFTGRVPFDGLDNSTAMLKIVSGKRPGRPKGTQIGLTDEVWGLICKCWTQEPSKRPEITRVVKKLEETVRGNFFIPRCSNSRCSHIDTI